MVDAAALALMAKVNKALGEDTFILASDLVVPPAFTTGSLSLDVALGGGFPGNQWTEVLGKESSGKTAMVLKAIAANQRLDANFTALWVAAEPFDKRQAVALGVDVSRVLLQPCGQEMEKAFTVLLEAAESQAVDFAVLDSYPAMISDEEDEKPMDADTVAKGARLFGRFVRKAGMATYRSHKGDQRPFCGVIINQWRDKIGSFQKFGIPQTSPGGNGKNYFFWARVDVARADWITEKRAGVKDPVKVGQTIRFKTVKNKAAASQQVANVDFYFRGAPTLGFKRGDYDVAGEYFAMGVLFKVIGRKGSWYTFGGEQWQGEPATVQALREDRGLQEAIAGEVLELASKPEALDILDGVE